MTATGWRQFGRGARALARDAKANSRVLLKNGQRALEAPLVQLELAAVEVVRTGYS